MRFNSLSEAVFCKSIKKTIVLIVKTGQIESLFFVLKTPTKTTETFNT